MQTPPARFSQQVREALAHLHAVSYLSRHPLADELATVDGHALRRILLEAIEELRPAQITPATQADARRQQHLVLRYVEGLSPEQVANALTVSSRQASRDLQQALQELTLLLWGRVAQVPPLARGSDAPDAYAAISSSGGSSLDERGGSVEGHPPVTGSRVAEGADALGAGADLQQVVRGVLSTLRKLLGAGGERRLLVRVSVPDTLPALAVEPDLLRQALLNLLLYVVSSGPRARSVVSAAESSRGVLLRLGLESAGGQPVHIPVPASASEEARALLESGQQLVSMLGGDLEIGADLAIALPAVGGYRLLVVDDNPDVGGLFRRFLRGEGYRVLQATSGATAVRLAREFRPHVVLLDVLLPTRDGWEIMSDLRSTPGMAETPVVICSVLPQEAMACSLQAADFLAKPVTRQSLLALLERWRPPPARTAPPGRWSPNA